MILVTNPFVRLWEAPIETLTLVGYGLLLATLLVVTIGVCWKNAVTTYTQYQKNWQRWSYLPPLTWVGRVAAIPFILMLDVWALAALIYLLT